MPNKKIDVMWLLAAILGFALPVSTALTNVMVPLCGLIGLYLGRHDLLTLIKRYPLLLVPLLLWLALGIGAFFSPAPDAWWYFSKYRKLLFIPLLALFFIKGSQKSIHFLIAGFLLGNFIIFVLSSLVWLTGPQEWWGFVLSNASFISKNAIAQSLLMALAAMLCIVVASIYRKWFWPLLLISVGMFVNVYLMSPQRTGHLAALILLLCWGAGYLKQRGRVAFIGVLTVTVIAGILFSNPIKDRAMKGINEALVCQKALNTAQQDVVCNTSLGLRTFYYVTAIERISLAPILGHGTGNVRMKIGPWDISNPHNEYLMQGLQIGLLGIVLYVALLLACMKMALSLPKVWACFVFGAVTAYMAGSLFNSFLLDFAEGYVLITLFALIVAACEINRQRTEECADA